MAERREAMEQQAVRDSSAAYSVEAEITTSEDVPPGYKRTEVGVIPEDWAVEIIGSVFQPTAGGDHKPSKSSEEFLDEYQYPIYANAIHNKGLYGYANYATAKAGSITVTARGTLGHADFRKAPFVAIGRLLVLEPKQKCEGFYFSEYINYGVKFSVESTGVPQLTAPQVAKYPLPVPPLKEQRAIATALSDADALIESLDRLIAKKRAIKQADMQQLLTGQTRLPGFTGEWKTKRLGEVAEIDPENLSSSTPLTFTFNYISLEQVEQGRLLGWSVERFSSAPLRARRMLRGGDVLVSTVRPNLQSHYFFDGALPSPVCSTGFAVVRCDARSAHSGYVYAHLFGTEVSRQIDKIIAGSNYPAISSGDVKRLTLPFPSIEEQTAIATVLSDMDTEIETLERRRDKARQIKQGMMQQLLTGRVRLVAPENREAAVC